MPSAAFLAVRAALKDAREGRPPYLWACFTDSCHRREILRTGWRDIGKVFAIAVLFDSLYQIFVLREFHPIQALIVASTLALVALFDFPRTSESNHTPMANESCDARTESGMNELIVYTTADGQSRSGSAVVFRAGQPSAVT